MSDVNKPASDVDAAKDAFKAVLTPKNVERKIVYMFVVVILLIGIVQLVLVHDEINKKLTRCSSSSITSFVVATLSIQLLAFIMSVAVLFNEFKHSKLSMILSIAILITWASGTVLWVSRAHFKSKAGAIATQSLLGVSSLLIAILLIQVIVASEHQNPKSNQPSAASQVNAN